MLAKPPNGKRALEYLVALGAVTMECLPGASLPDELRARGYEVTATGEGERILPTAIVEKFVTGADGTFVALTEGSTRPIASTVTHAGICKVKRYSFDMP